MIGKITFLFLALLGGRADACSEAGTKEFAPRKAAEAVCAAQALDMALAVATAQYPAQKKVDLAAAPFRKSSSQLNAAKREVTPNYSNESLTFSASVVSDNGWDCLYCVTFELRDGKTCYFQKIAAHHCAK